MFPALVTAAADWSLSISMAARLQLGPVLDQHEPLLREVRSLLDIEDVQGEVVRCKDQRPVRVAFTAVGQQVGRQSWNEASGT